MSYDPQQLATLAAVVEAGTFDYAALDLAVTPSAVSQRIKALERAVGQVVVTRTKPCRPTGVGRVLLRHARQVSLLDAETRAELGGAAEGWISLALVVNADSLATWFADVLAEVADWGDVALELHVEDQQFSADQLRAGAVMAAVTADPRPVSGCTVSALGSMTYVPVARPDVVERWSVDGSPDLTRMPIVHFNSKDDEQQAILRAEGVDHEGPAHYVPSSADFATAVRLGLGWGAIPHQQLGDDLATGRLVRVAASEHVVPLYWQRWRIESEVLSRVTAAVTRVADNALDPAPGPR